MEPKLFRKMFTYIKYGLKGARGKTHRYIAHVTAKTSVIIAPIKVFPNYHKYYPDVRMDSGVTNFPTIKLL